MLDHETQEKLDHLLFASQNKELSRVLFSVQAMLNRNSLLALMADQEKNERFIMYLSSLRVLVRKVLAEFDPTCPTTEDRERRDLFRPEGK